MKQKSKAILGWSIIILAALIPAFIFRPNFQPFPFSSIGRIFALIGVTLFALNFVLSTRLKFLEEIFGGMDKVYLVHGITGGIAFMFILAHPIFMIADYLPKNLAIAAGYFIPGNILYLDFGLIAIFLLISLIFVTFFTRIKYNQWKFTHEFLGLAFIFSLLHMFFGTGGGAKGFYIFASIIGVIGLSAFTYSLIARKKFLKYADYRIRNVKINKNVIELDLEPENKPIRYESGQFIFLRFYNEKLSKEPHPFSISSKSNSPIIKVFIKESGDFTKKLISLRNGDRISVEGPYGKFNFKNFESKKQVWIAGGIGITPFIGMIEELKENPEKNVTLIYTFKENYIITKKDFNDFEKIKNFKFVPWNSEKLGLLDIGKIIDLSSGIKNADILICGPPQFKEYLIKSLRELKIKKKQIHEEVFELK